MSEDKLYYKVVTVKNLEQGLFRSFFVTQGAFSLEYKVSTTTVADPNSLGIFAFKDTESLNRYIHGLLDRSSSMLYRAYVVIGTSSEELDSFGFYVDLSDFSSSTLDAAFNKFNSRTLETGVCSTVNTSNEYVTFLKDFTTLSVHPLMTYVESSKPAPKVSLFQKMAKYFVEDHTVLTLSVMAFSALTGILALVKLLTPCG